MSKVEVLVLKQTCDICKEINFENYLTPAVPTMDYKDVTEQEDPAANDQEITPHEKWTIFFVVFDNTNENFDLQQSYEDWLQESTYHSAV